MAQISLWGLLIYKLFVYYRLGGVMVCVLALDVEDRGFDRNNISMWSVM
jgi:hypothetical protein